MTQIEHLLLILSEELLESALRLHKALRFSLREVQPGQSLDNAARVTHELNDVLAMLDLLRECGLVLGERNEALIEAKKRKVLEQFLPLSVALGCVRDADCEKCSEVTPEEFRATSANAASLTLGGSASIDGELKTQQRALKRQELLASNEAKAQEDKKQQRKELSNTIRRVFRHWKTVMDKPSAKLTDDRVRLIQRTLVKLGYDEQTLINAINGCAMTAHNMGIRPDGQPGPKYNGLELILRDAAHIERFAETATNQSTAIKPYDRQIAAAEHFADIFSNE